SKSPISTAMMAMTTSSSISVKPPRLRGPAERERNMGEMTSNEKPRLGDRRDRWRKCSARKLTLGPEIGRKNQKDPATATGRRISLAAADSSLNAIGERGRGRPRSRVGKGPAVAVGVLGLASPCAAAKVDFSRDVLPILSAQCFACHGPDAGKRKAGLRLDVRASALAVL